MAKAKWKNFSMDEIRDIVKKSTSFVQVQKALGYSGNSGTIPQTLKEVFDNNNIDYSHFKGHAWNKKDYYEDNDFGTTNNRLIKEKLFSERGNKCEECGITSWNGKEIILQLHHIDGNSNNNKRENLQLLCPNCHSQTENFCNKNTKGSKRITDEEFLEALENSTSICAACRLLGITPNQNNYARARKLMQNSEI